MSRELLSKISLLFRKLGPDWLTVLSAVLIVASFPPWNISHLIWFALVPWFAALHRSQGTRAATLQGLWLSILMSLGGFYWVAFVLKEFGGIPGWLAQIGLLLFSLIGQPQFTLFAAVWRWVHLSAVGNASSWARRLTLAALLGLAYAGVDWILPKLFVDTLGHSMYRATYMRQIADIGGATLLTFVIFLVNETLFSLIQVVVSTGRGLILRNAAIPLLASLFMVCGIYLYGSQRYAEVLAHETSPRATVQAAVIQANIGDFDKIAAERGISGAASKVIHTFFKLSDQALAMTPKPELLIWPETSYPSTFRTPQTSDEMARDQKIERYVREREAPLLFGGYDHAQGKDFNALFYLSPKEAGGVDSSGDLKIYRKNMLLLFGEYIPGAEQFQIIKSTFPQVGNFGRGEGPSVVEVNLGKGKTVKTGPIICYEALFPNYVIEAARKGSDMILNITNDSWFGPTSEPELHLSLTIFRSIETRLPQLRATNTGISALILPNGEITHPTEVGAATVLNVAVPLIEPIPTLMKRWGDWFGPTALLLGWLGLLVAMGWGGGLRSPLL